MHRTPSWFVRMTTILVGIAIMSTALMAGPAPRALADGPETTLFRAEFDSVPLGPLSGSLTVENGSVVAQAGAEAVGKGMGGADINGDVGRIALIHQFLQREPLRFAVDFFVVGGGISIHGVQPAVGFAAEGKPFHAFFCAAVKEDVDGGAPRREDSGRDQREENRIFGVFATGDNPHLRVVLAHECRQMAFEAKLEPLLLDFSLPA